MMYFAERAALLRRLLGYLRPGGFVVCHEMDMEGTTSEPGCRGFEAAERIRQTFARAGIDTRAWLKRGRIFQEADLANP